MFDQWAILQQAISLCIALFIENRRRIFFGRKFKKGPFYYVFFFFLRKFIYSQQRDTSIIKNIHLKLGIGALSRESYRIQYKIEFHGWRELSRVRGWSDSVDSVCYSPGFIGGSDTLLTQDSGVKSRYVEDRSQKKGRSFISRKRGFRICWTVSISLLPSRPLVVASFTSNTSERASGRARARAPVYAKEKRKVGAMREKEKGDEMTVSREGGLETGAATGILTSSTLVSSR